MKNNNQAINKNLELLYYGHCEIATELDKRTCTNKSANKQTMIFISTRTTCVVNWIQSIQLNIMENELDI